jgi:ATP-binding cassette subfamily B protein
VQQSSLRAAIGIVRRILCYSTTRIQYNIHYGRTDATREEVIEAARAAHIHDFHREHS